MADQAYACALGRRVDTYRLAQHLTIAQAAARCELDYMTFWRLLQGYDVRVSTIRAVSRGLKIPIGILLAAA